jgi:flagellar basal body rod protein FlgG
MIDFSAPLAGLNRAEAALNQVASQVAQAGDPAANVDLSAEAVGLIQARTNVQVAVKMMQAEDQMAKSLLQIIG